MGFQHGNRTGDREEAIQALRGVKTGDGDPVREALAIVAKAKNPTNQGTWDADCLLQEGAWDGPVGAQEPSAGSEYPSALGQSNAEARRFQGTQDQRGDDEVDAFVVQGEGLRCGDVELNGVDGAADLSRGNFQGVRVPVDPDEDGARLGIGRGGEKIAIATAQIQQGVPRLEGRDFEQRGVEGAFGCCQGPDPRG